MNLLEEGESERKRELDAAAALEIARLVV